ncbi:hypothetical protein ASF82_13295 [Frigoribacterium sp. Leaf164]|uniref:hypothetical protein n=1 Tax=Frigoribacterium sp. Leaf164 TaxID=1736282 RepID=UPI0006FA5E5B|nr:hypothetical protein [Frigoribacterium sp. Leaf164]KQR44418.1 hypothetical protein ASF82_13295 [Frigoribacterium sp. Leaf164]
MTDPDEFVGSEADRRFREELRRSLEAADREGDGASEADEAATGLRPASGSTGSTGSTARPSTRGAGPAAGPGDATPASPAKPPRSRLDVFMDWAPLGVGLLAIAAIAVIALYGISGGDLGPW